MKKNNVKFLNYTGKWLNDHLIRDCISSITTMDIIWDISKSIRVTFSVISWFFALELSNMVTLSMKI